METDARIRRETQQPSRARRLVQFSLRGLLVLVAILAVWLGIAFHRAREQARAVVMIESLGGSVTYEYQWSASGAWIPDAAAPGPEWLQAVFGKNYGAKVIEVQLFAGPGKRPEQFDDENAAMLSALTDVQWLVLMDTRITDAALPHLYALAKLERLDLEGSLVTDRGIEELRKRLPNVRVYY